MLLSGCQGGGGGSVSGGGLVTSAGGVVGIQLGGGGADGPVAGGIVEFSDAYDNTCGDLATTNDSGRYTAVIPLDCTFPIQMTLTGGYDMVGDNDNYTEMRSLALDNGVDLANITPLSTIIYYAALARSPTGGLASVSVSDLDLVTRTAVRYFNFGIDDSAPDADTAYNPITAAINTDNACIFVKANEGLIEAVRRTDIYWQDTARASLSTSSIDWILQALGEDIADGVLDGAFDGAVTPGGTRLASLWNLSAATVSMELMQNKFSITKQDGTILAANSSRLMNAAEQISNAVFVPEDIDNVGVSLGFIRQAKAAAAAADVLAGTGNSLGYDKFVNSLMAMESELAGGATQPLAADVVRQIMTDNTVVIPDNNKVSAVIGDNRAVSASKYDTVLNKSAAVMNEALPVLPKSRMMHIEWAAYPATVNHDGFKIYISVNNAAPQVCPVSSAGATSADCPLEAAPGDSIKVSMTATTSTGQESAQSSSYTNTIPRASFTADIISGTCGFSADFDAAGTGSAAAGVSRVYDWYFSGDGGGALDAGSSYTYIFNNSSNALLTVTDTVDGVFSASGQASLDIDCW